MSSEKENSNEEPHDDFFGVKQYSKKRSLSNGDAFLPKEVDEPIADTALPKNPKMTMESSETKSNTDSNPTSNNKPPSELTLVKKHSQPIDKPFVAQQANMQVNLLLKPEDLPMFA